MSDHTPSRLTAHRALAAGYLVGPVFLTLWALQAFTRDGYRPAYHPLSLLSLGDLGWIQIVNFVLCGVLHLILAYGVHVAVSGLICYVLLIRRWRAQRQRVWVIIGIVGPLTSWVIAAWPDLNSLGPRLVVSTAVQFAYLAAITACAQQELTHPQHLTRSPHPAGFRPHCVQDVDPVNAASTVLCV